MEKKEKKMKRNTTATNSEKYRFRTLTGYDEIVIHLSASAGKWLARATRANDGSYISHSTLLWDLVSRMSLTASSSKGFRHTLHLSPGMAQYSELQLQTEWGMGRKVIRRLLAQMENVGLIYVHRSTVASTIAFSFIKGWRISGKEEFIENPDYLEFCPFDLEKEEGL